MSVKNLSGTPIWLTWAGTRKMLAYLRCQHTKSLINFSLKRLPAILRSSCKPQSRTCDGIWEGISDSGYSTWGNRWCRIHGYMPPDSMLLIEIAKPRGGTTKPPLEHQSLTAYKRLDAPHNTVMVGHLRRLCNCCFRCEFQNSKPCITLYFFDFNTST